jgi:hypothetical protein
LSNKEIEELGINRKEASAAGETTYHGSECGQCGTTLRRVANGSCVNCEARRANERYHIKNPNAEYRKPLSDEERKKRRATAIRRYNTKNRDKQNAKNRERRKSGIHPGNVKRIDMIVGEVYGCSEVLSYIVSRVVNFKNGRKCPKCGRSSAIFESH